MHVIQTYNIGTAITNYQCWLTLAVCVYRCVCVIKPPQPLPQTMNLSVIVQGTCDSATWWALMSMKNVLYKPPNHGADWLPRDNRDVGKREGMQRSEREKHEVGDNDWQMEVKWGQKKQSGHFANGHILKLIPNVTQAAWWISGLWLEFTCQAWTSSCHRQ